MSNIKGTNRDQEVFGDDYFRAKKEKIEKDCEGRCPGCGTEIIHINYDDSVKWYRNRFSILGECQLCGCIFREYLKYDVTEYEK